MGEDVFLDNLPESTNMILNVLWDYNREMMLTELTELVNKKYGTNWTEKHTKEFANVLVVSEYAEKKHHGFKTYYIALGAEFELDES